MKTAGDRRRDDRRLATSYGQRIIPSRLTFAFLWAANLAIHSLKCFSLAFYGKLAARGKANVGLCSDSWSLIDS